MLVKVWWEDLRKAVRADSTQGTSEYQGAGTSLSIFALVSGNFTGFHTHTEWMSPPCPGGQGGQGGFKWLVHERSMKRGSATTCERLLCLFYTQNKKILDYQTWPTHLFAKFTKCAKVYGLFSWFYFSDADWLGRQTPITWQTYDRKLSARWSW